MFLVRPISFLWLQTYVEGSNSIVQSVTGHKNVLLMIMSSLLTHFFHDISPSNGAVRSIAYVYIY